MNNIDLHELGRSFREDMEHPTLLFEETGLRIFWLGIPEATVFRCNIYLVVNNDEAVIIDPGGVGHFDVIYNRVAQILSPERVVAQVLSHQDPDVAASFPLWADVNPSIKVITSTRTNTVLSYFRDFSYELFNVHDHPEFRFTSGKTLKFILSPFMHSPGAFVTYDPLSRFLFSGDIWATLDMDWKLVLDDFDTHELKLNLFHLDYMASNIAARGFINRISHYDIDAILPQHGSIIPREFVPRALDYLAELNCGIDVIYPELK